MEFPMSAWAKLPERVKRMMLAYNENPDAFADPRRNAVVRLKIGASRVAEIEEALSHVFENSK